MNRTRNILFNVSFAVNCLLVFLLCFESRVSLPPWLQVAGRTHPMLLHFPIVFILLYVFYLLIIQKKIQPASVAKETGDWLLLLSAFTASITAIAGFFLSREEGYDPEALQWHKWGGVAISLLMFGWYGFRNSFARSRPASIGATIIAFFAILVTGHQGAGITHGQNFLLAPIMPETMQQQPLLEDAVVFTHMVQPILDAKCMSCHNSKKAKGDLVMETRELLLKGGKNGKLWDSTEADYGLLLKRIHLPLETKKHMPPQGKPQLTADEIEILSEWIRMGADFNIKVTELHPDHALKRLADKTFSTIETGDYDFAAADESKIKSLNTNYRVVYPLAKNSPALGAEFFSATQFTLESLKELLAVKDQLVSLNLDKMPVKDDDLAMIGQFRQLRKLNLSFTQVTGRSINELKKLDELRQLSLSGSRLNSEFIDDLISLTQLTKIYLWNTGLKAEDIERLRKKNLVVETGFRGDTIVLKLTPPLLQNEKQIITEPATLKLKHYINGVTIRYTLDGSRPDSINSPVYKDDVQLTGTAHLKAIAYKQGWLSSDTTTGDFYAAKFRIDSLTHLLPPDNAYKDEKSKTLIDLVKGDFNYGNGKWVGFRQNSMQALLRFAQPRPINSVTVSALVDIPAYLMPPLLLEVWGGEDPGQLKLLGRLVPVQPSRQQPRYFKNYLIELKPGSYRYLKVVAQPVPKLPVWHQGKGDRGWFFTDEIFVN